MGSSSLTNVNMVSTRANATEVFALSFFKFQLATKIKNQSSANLLQDALSELDKYKRGSDERRGNVYEKVVVL